MNMRTWVLSALVGTLALPAHAQLGETRVISAGYEYQPDVRLRGGKVGFQVFRGLLSLPISLGKQTHLIPLLGYEQVHVQTVDLRDDGDLRTASLGLNLAQQINERWTLILGGTGGLASNFASKLSNEDLFWTVNAMVLYTTSPRFTFGFGGTYDQRRGMPLPLPLLALRWEPTPKLGLRGTAPGSLYFAWRPARPITFELVAALSGQRYHLSNEAYDGTDTRLAYSTVKLGGGWRVHFTDKLHLELLAGGLVARRFEKVVDDEKQGHAYLPAGAFFGGSLWFGTSGWIRPFEERP